MYLRWFLVILVCSHSVCSALPVHAAVQTFTATHTYVLGDDDSRNGARQKCLAEAKRKILEQVGVYLESHSELLTSAQSGEAGSTKSSKTTNEERQQMTERITTLTAGIMKTNVVKEEFGDVNGRLQITLTVKADIDPDDIQKQLAAQRADQGVRKQVNEQEQRIEELEARLHVMMEDRRSLGENQRGGSKQSTKSTDDPQLYFIREFANEGHADAQAYLGLMYVTGKDKSYPDALIWFRKAAAQGNGYGQAGLGWMSAMGRGVPQSDTEAVTWFRKAAQQGNAIGQFNLGMMYLHGIGVPQSDTEAVRWFRKAAKQGHLEGLLVSQMMDGVVPQNETELLALLRKAADHQIAAMWQTGPGTLNLSYPSLERRGKP